MEDNFCCSGPVFAEKEDCDSKTFQDHEDDEGLWSALYSKSHNLDQVSK